MKKTNKPDYYKDIIKVLTELKDNYPSYTMGRHMSTILDQYSDVWGVSDKEFLFAITKYRAELEMDVPRETDEVEIQRILKDGMKLSINDFDEEI